MTLHRFAPRVSGSHDFVCAICQVPTWTAISLDHFPVCSMCRWFGPRRHSGLA